jgi:hypothetical protein
MDLVLAKHKDEDGECAATGRAVTVTVSDEPPLGAPDLDRLTPVLRGL